VSVRDHSGTARDEMVVARLHALAPHLDGEPDPAFRTATRARLVAMAAVRTPEPEPVSPVKRLLSRAEEAARSRWRTRLTAGLAGAAMTVTTVATLVALSADARPGDVLYGLKRGTEQTQLALAGDARGQTLLDFARTRLHELEDLAEGGASALPAPPAPTAEGTQVLAADVDADLVLETLDTMDDQTLEGAAWMTHEAVTTGDDSLLSELAGWAQDQSAGLAALRPSLPDSTLDEVDSSLTLLADIDTRTVGLTDALQCAPEPAIETTDALGPVPGLCLDQQPSPPAAGGEGDPGTVPAPGSGAEGSTAGPTATPGGGTDGGVPGTSGSGQGGLPTGGLPGTEVPSGEDPVETPALPLPPLPTTLPNLPGSSPSTSTPSPTLPSVELCLGPIVLGDCTD
jgi:hypothetical protein